MTEPPRRGPPRTATLTATKSIEGLLREVLVGHATLAQQIDGIDRRVDGVQADAREARDAARDSAAATRAQDIPARFAELKGSVEKANSDARSDLVNSISKVTAEMRDNHDAHAKILDDHGARIGMLESRRERFDGATGVFGWVAKNMPWLIAAATSVVAIFESKGHHP